ncbi:MAG: patatin-like phospholipase family protein [Marinifilaceae bacterium]
MVRKITVMLLMLLLPFGMFAERKKVGVVLSGGGALGVAHIGVLKVLEEAGIPIDYIAGTSMGSLVGALYAIGYDAKTLDSLVRIQNWRFLLSDKQYQSDKPFYEKEYGSKYLFSLPIKNKKIELPGGLLGGQNIYNLFMELTIGYHDSISFFTLPIPFNCVATNILTGEPYVMKSGVLPIAMRSSMSIPGVFSPMHLDSMVLVDGGVANNFPVNVCTDMGADILIGVDLNTGYETAEDLTSAKAVLDQMIDLLGNTEYVKNKNYLLENPDKCLYLNPNLQGYTIASFTQPAIDSMILMGERVARANWDKIIALKEAAGVPATVDASPHLQNKYLDHKSIFIEDIKISGVPVEEESYIRQILRLKEYEHTSYQDINQGITYLYGTGIYQKIDYSCIPTAGSDRYNLIIKLTPKKLNSLNLGFRFDTETMASILVNTTLGGGFLKESKVSLSVRLSKNPYVVAQYNFGNELLHGFGIKYKFQYNDLDWSHKGRKVSNVTFFYDMGELSFTTFYRQNLKFKLGFEFEYFKFGTMLYAEGYTQQGAKSRGYANYTAELQYESINLAYFPTKGVNLLARYKVFTTNMLNNEGYTPFQSIYFQGYAPLKIAHRFYAIPAVYSRVLIGKHIPFQYLNCMGGQTPGQYMNQQIPFMGLHDLELFDNSLLMFQAKLRYRIGYNNYITLTGNYAKQHDYFKQIFKGNDIWGGGITASHNSLVGPIELTFNMSNWDTKFGVFFSAGYYF